MVHHLHGRHLIIGVDRLDYSKGLEERFRAYERLLENYPAIRNQVSYIQIAPATRSGFAPMARFARRWSSRRA